MTTFDLSQVEGHVVVVDPMTACDKISNKLELKGKIAIIRRGDCKFIVKARAIEKHGAIGGIIIGLDDIWLMIE
jgi:mannosidase alpha-like ER degradation enhancer 3